MDGASRTAAEKEHWPAGLCDGSETMAACGPFRVEACVSLHHAVAVPNGHTKA